MTLYTKKAFTLIELLLVIGIIAILAGIVILAINPTSQLRKAEDSKRTAHVRELKSAILQYQIDHGSIPAGITTTSTPICRYGITDPSCVNLDVLVDEDYVTTLDVDTLESDVHTTGYTVNQNEGGFTVVAAEYIGLSSGDSGGGPTTPVTIEADQLIGYTSTSSVFLAATNAVIAPTTKVDTYTNIAIAATNGSSPLQTVSTTSSIVLADTDIKTTENFTTNRTIAISVTPTVTTCAVGSPFASISCNPAGFTFASNNISQSGNFYITSDIGDSNSLVAEGYEVQQITNLVPGNHDISLGQSFDPIVHNDYLYFQGVESADNVKLYRTNGTTLQKMTDITDAPSTGDRIENPTVFNGKLFFYANDSALTSKLYSFTDSAVLRESNRNVRFDDLRSMTVMGSNLYAIGCSNTALGLCHFKLLKYDGTTWSIVSNLRPGNDDVLNSVPATLKLPVLNNEIYFVGYNSSNRLKLYKSNGTTVTQVSDIYPGADDFNSSDSRLMYYTIYNNHLYFNATGGFYKTNGSVVTRIHNSGVQSFTVMGTDLYFGSWDGLFVTDGTTVTQVSDVPAGAMQALNGILYFGASLEEDEGMVSYLFAYDGSSVVKISTGFGGGVSNLQLWDNELLYSAYSYSEGGGIFKYDGETIKKIAHGHTLYRSIQYNNDVYFLSAFSGNKYKLFRLHKK